MPRHTAHGGFGLRDLRRLLTGPGYAARYAGLAARAGIAVETSATATAWAGPTALDVTTPAGLVRVEADAVVLATGCRERPRSARLVPGDRPAGVLTTGALQQAVYLHRQPVGRRAVVVGAEHVSFSAVHTLAHAGARTVAVVTELPRDQTFAALRWATATRRGVPVLAHGRVTGIVGTRRVEAVELTDLRSGTTRRLACDTVVFTGDWMPDHELARRGGLAMDAATRAPRVDQALRTSARGVFGGNWCTRPRTRRGGARRAASAGACTLPTRARGGAICPSAASRARWCREARGGRSRYAARGRFVLASGSPAPRPPSRQGGRGSSGAAGRGLWSRTARHARVDWPAGLDVAGRRSCSRSPEPVNGSGSTHVDGAGDGDKVRVLLERDRGTCRRGRRRRLWCRRRRCGSLQPAELVGRAESAVEEACAEGFTPSEGSRC